MKERRWFYWWKILAALFVLPGVAALAAIVIARFLLS